MKFSKLLVLLLILSGLASTFYLSQQYHRFHSGNLEDPSICTVNETVNCDAVLASPYAAIAGIPWSTLGLFFYAFLTVMGLRLFAANQLQVVTAASFISGFGLLAFIIDLPLAFILATKIKVLCLFCLLSYLINLALFLMGKFAIDPALRRQNLLGLVENIGLGFVAPIKAPRSFASWLPVFALAVGLGVAGGSTLYWQKTFKPKAVAQSNELKDRLKELLNRLPDRAGVDFELSESPQKGSSEAPLTFVEFSDFECPHCRYAAGMFADVVSRYPNEVRVIFKHYPLDRNCNPKITRDLHQKACLFARAGYCARMQPPKDLFWDLHDLFFEKGATLDEGGLLNEVEKRGLNRKQFTACLKSEKSLKAVRRDLELGDRLGIDSTPSVYLNGRLLPNYRLLQMDVFPTLLEVELERLAGKKSEDKTGQQSGQN